MEQIIENSLKIPGYMTIQEMNILLSWLKIFDPLDSVTLVEIGSFMGRTASIFAQYFKNGKIYCIDSWDGKCDSFIDFINKNNIKDTKSIKLYIEYFKTNNLPFKKNENSLKNFKKHTKNYENIISLKLISPYELTFWEEKIDVFFLDALHRNPNDWDNIEFWFKFMKKNSIFMGHDYHHKNFPDVVENVHKLEHIINKKAIIENTLWKFYL